MRKYLLAGAATLAMASGAQAGEMTTGSGAIIGRAEPGKAVVRFDGAVVTMIGFGGGTNNSATVAGGQTVKNDPFGMIMYARMYPAFDAQTTGGLRYGAFAEIRANGTIGGRNANTLYWNRAYGYIGGDSWGLVRFGMTDGALALLQVGTFQNFADGGLNGSAPGLLPSSDSYIWRFPFSQGAEYARQQITYLSPKFMGFDAAVSFSPSTANHVGGALADVDTGGSSRQATSVAAGDLNRYRNRFSVNVRYSNTFGGVGIAANVGYMGSGVVAVAGTPQRGLSIFDAGAQLSYMGFSVGGHMSTGTFNGALNLSAPGEKPGTVWLVGASYSTGPWTAGIHYLNASLPGTIGNGAKRIEQGVGAGVTYAWAPGVRTFVEFVHHDRRENGVDLRRGTGVASKVSGSAIVLGQAFRW